MIDHAFRYHSTLARDVDAFQAGAMDTNQIVRFAQDLIDAREITSWGPRAYELVVHCLREGLATVPEGPRALH